jgi:hypothetical protein
MQSTLVVCYSYTRTARRVAQLLASQRGWPLGEVVDPQPRGRLRCVLDSLLRRQPSISYRGPDPGKFRCVVLVAPVWMQRLPGPMRSFLVQHRQNLHRVAVIATDNESGADKVCAEVTRIRGHAPMAKAAFLQRGIEDGSSIGELLAFGNALQPASAVRPLQLVPRTARAA